MKRILSVAVAVILSMSSVAAIASDYENHWVKTDAQYLIDEGIITLAADGNIKPDEQIIRGEFVRMMNKIFRFHGNPTEEYKDGHMENQFRDIPIDNQYYEDCLIARKNGYLAGDENGNAKPFDQITRAEVAVILSRLNKLDDAKETYPEADIPVWAFGAVGALIKVGIMKGNTNGEFKGYDNLTNAEAYTIGARTRRAMPPKGPDVYMIGDSHMQIYPDQARPQTGWGEMLPKYLKSNVVVYNHALGGRSTKSFMDEGRWDKVIKTLKTGDYVIISFGGNDQKPDEKLHTDPQTTYKDNLRKYINETRAKGATPIICSSINRRSFKGDKITNSMGEYPKAAIELAQEAGVFYVDLNKESELLFNEYGPEGTKKLFLILASGESPNYPEGKTDNSHFQTLGADLITKIFAKKLYEGDCPLKEWLNPDSIK